MAELWTHRGHKRRPYLVFQTYFCRKMLGILSDLIKFPILLAIHRNSVYTVAVMNWHVLQPLLRNVSQERLIQKLIHIGFTTAENIHCTSRQIWTRPCGAFIFHVVITSVLVISCCLFIHSAQGCFVSIEKMVWLSPKPINLFRRIGHKCPRPHHNKTTQAASCVF